MKISGSFKIIACSLVMAGALAGAQQAQAVVFTPPAAYCHIESPCKWTGGKAQEGDFCVASSATAPASTVSDCKSRTHVTTCLEFSVTLWEAVCYRAHESSI